MVDASFSSLASTSSSGSNSYEVESEVGREALKEICCSVLSRMLDFPGGQLEAFLGFDEEVKRKGEDRGMNVAKNIAVGLRFMKRGLSSISHVHSYQRPNEVATCAAQVLIIGTPITSESQIAFLQAITHLHNFVILEGLFRKPGNKSRIELLVNELGKSGMNGVVANTNYTGHDYASVLKQLLSELPEPLLVKRHLGAYLQASALSSPSKTRCIQLLMLLLPPSHRIILQHLLDLFSQVICSSQSRMDALNLALVFAPTLFLASKSEMLSAASLSSLSSLLKFMIENPEEIFEVPVEVQVVAERYCKKKRRYNRDSNYAFLGNVDSAKVGDDDVAMDMYTTSCKRERIEDFHKAGQERASAEVMQLMEFIQNMPDGPQKTHFLKRLESAKKLSRTPVHPKTGSLRAKLGSNKAKRAHLLCRDKENTTPLNCVKPQPCIDLLKPCLKKGSLIPEFDQVDMSSTHSYTTPMKSNHNNTPALKKVRIVATNSPIVTDV